MKTPTPANPIHTSPHLATAQVREGYRSKTWVSQCHNLSSRMTDIFTLMPDQGQALLLSPSSLNFKWKRVGLHSEGVFSIKNTNLSWCVPGDGQLGKEERSLRCLLDGF